MRNSISKFEQITFATSTSYNLTTPFSAKQIHYLRNESRNKISKILYIKSKPFGIVLTLIYLKHLTCKIVYLKITKNAILTVTVSGDGVQKHSST